MMINAQNTAPIRVGVIGLGYAGEPCLKGYKLLPNVEVLALAGLEEDRLQQLGYTYHVPHLYRDYQDLLAREDLDAVSIAVPNSLHVPVTIDALERGLHVLSEKPLAHTAAEAESMVEVAIKANCVLQVVFNHRERNDLQKQKNSAKSRSLFSMETPHRPVALITGGSLEPLLYMSKKEGAEDQ